MPRLKLTIAAAAICAIGATLAGRAEAGALAGAQAIRPALADMNVIETVHCVPGYEHRRRWPYDGCPRPVYRENAYRYDSLGPRPFHYESFGPHAYGYPNYYRPGPSFGAGANPYGYWGPGMSVGFGF
jgi:hypothetical protein